MFLQKMNKFSIMMLVAATVLFVACKDEKKSSSSNNTPIETVQDIESQTNATNDVVLNPPHGQPGHRCDIRVGDPLPQGSSVSTNSPVIQAQPQSNQSPVIKSTGNVPVNGASTTTSGNVNPPHGQPGHRCEIPVGAPLD